MKHTITDDNYSTMDVIVEKDQFCIRNQVKDESGGGEGVSRYRIGLQLIALHENDRHEKNPDYDYFIDQILNEIKKRDHILLGKRDGLKVYELLGQFLGEL